MSFNIVLSYMFVYRVENCLVRLVKKAAVTRYQ